MTLCLNNNFSLHSEYRYEIYLFGLNVRSFSNFHSKYRCNIYPLWLCVWTITFHSEYRCKIYRFWLSVRSVTFHSGFWLLSYRPPSVWCDVAGHTPPQPVWTGHRTCKTLSCTRQWRQRMHLRSINSFTYEITLLRKRVLIRIPSSGDLTAPTLNVFFYKVESCPIGFFIKLVFFEGIFEH